MSHKKTQRRKTKTKRRKEACQLAFHKFESKMLNFDNITDFTEFLDKTK